MLQYNSKSNNNETIIMYFLAPLFCEQAWNGIKYMYMVSKTSLFAVRYLLEIHFTELRPLTKPLFLYLIKFNFKLL